MTKKKIVRAASYLAAVAAGASFGAASLSLVYHPMHVDMRAALHAYRDADSLAVILMDRAGLYDSDGSDEMADYLHAANVADSLTSDIYIYEH